MATLEMIEEEQRTATLPHLSNRGTVPCHEGSAVVRAPATGGEHVATQDHPPQGAREWWVVGDGSSAAGGTVLTSAARPGFGRYPVRGGLRGPDPDPAAESIVVLSPFLGW